MAQITVGAGLPAMAAGQVTLMLEVLAPFASKRAPTGFGTLRLPSGSTGVPGARFGATMRASTVTA